MKLPQYSVAIRTLGTSGEKFEKEIFSIGNQTVQPEKIFIYIAEGYPKPQIDINNVEYIYVKKGMVAQRALQYTEISSEYILLLDDDVYLANDAVEKLLKSATEHDADCVGADTFKNQDMSLLSKIYAGTTNLVFPRFDDSWAFKINRNGSFSYNNHPKPDFYLSESCAGPASLWKKSALLAIHLEDELWLDQLGFAFGDDLVETYKLYINGYKLGVHYGATVEHLDGKSGSSVYQNNSRKFYIRSKSSFIIWWRICYNLPCNSAINKVYAILMFTVKVLWLLVVNIIAGLYMRNPKIPCYYFKGIIDGIFFINSPSYKEIHNFVVEK